MSWLGKALEDPDLQPLWKEIRHFAAWFLSRIPCNE